MIKPEYQGEVRLRLLRHLEDAKVLQMLSFIAPVFENIPEADREAMAAQFEESIRNIVHNS